MSEDEPKTFARRHKTLIRRQGSFRRIQSVPERVDSWFNSDAELHRSWDDFATSNRQASPVFQPQAKDGVLLEADHAARAVHEHFCDFFETSLSKYLDSIEISMEQFQEAFRLSKDEEERDGACFYRWPEVVEFEVFLNLMRFGSQGLLKRISELVDEARLEHRRKVTFFPLLVEWAPENFEDVDSLLSAAITDAKASLNLSKAEQKELVRWRAKLTTKVLKDGVYQPPPRDEESWARYLAFKTSKVGPIALECILDFLHERVAANVDGVKSQCRSALLKAFSAMDTHHRGWVSLETIRTVVLKAGVIPEKAVKRIFVQRYALQNQRTKDAQLTSTSGEPSDAERIDMVQVLDLLTDLLKPTSGDDAVALFQARIQKVEETAANIC